MPYVDISGGLRGHFGTPTWTFWKTYVDIRCPHKNLHKEDPSIEDPSLDPPQCSDGSSDICVFGRNWRSQRDKCSVYAGFLLSHSIFSILKMRKA
jgi:hypothetical protein